MLDLLSEQTVQTLMECVIRVPSKCQIVWIQFSSDILSVLIPIKAICNGYQQTALQCSWHNQQTALQCSWHNQQTALQCSWHNQQAALQCSWHIVKELDLFSYGEQWNEFSRTPDRDFRCFYPCLSHIPVTARGKVSC